MQYIQRITKPEKGNKYYIRKCSGGYSKACEGKVKATGKPDPDCDTLANCVGYAYGRFHELIGDTTMSWCCPVNAEDFPYYAKKCKQGREPKLGSIIVWRKGKAKKKEDGYGHVAIVEQINEDGSILISQSGYNSKAFWTETLVKGDGNWRATWMAKDYYFTCFIYSPIDFESKINELDLLYNNKKYTVNSIVKNQENYIKLADARDKLKLCDVSWDAKNGVVITNSKCNCLQEKGTLDVTLMSPIKHKVNAELYNENYYIRLRDFDEVLGLCKVTYNNIKHMPEVKSNG